MPTVGEGKERKKRSKSKPRRERIAEEAVKKNEENHLINMMQPGPISEVLADYIPSADMLQMGEVSSALNDSTRDIYDEGIKRDLKFKELWEKNKLHEFFYTVPCWHEDTVRGRGQGRVIYKINKKKIDNGSYRSRARRPTHRSGPGDARNYGCLNNITYYKELFTIYDFEYTVPTVDKPIELDEKWKLKIKLQYVSEGFDDWDAEQEHLVEERYAELTKFLKDGVRVPPEYNRFTVDTTGTKLLDKTKIAEMMEKDRYNWCYIDEQRAWFNDVFKPYEEGKDIVELTSLWDDAKKMFKGLVSSCSVQGGRRKRTRRRRNKNRKKRTKKRARRKRRRKSSKRKRGRKR